MTIDHKARAEVLSDWLGQLCKVNEDCFDVEPPVIIDGDKVSVPFRYAADTYDGSSCWIEWADDLDEMSVALRNAVNGEVPWLALSVIDLDTGATWPVSVKVTVEAEPEEECATRAGFPPRAPAVVLPKSGRAKRCCACGATISGEVRRGAR